MILVKSRGFANAEYCTKGSPTSLSKSFRGKKLVQISGLALAVAALASTASAQDNAGSVLEEIQVTGTRIIRSGLTSPTPVTAVDAQELQAMSPGNLLDSLSQLPQFFNNQTTTQVNGGQNSGGSNVNLRGAGVNRTLVLLDGRRIVPSNRFGTVDVGMFPEDLIERVETVTGGASASYGTDAVAGVVNFILDTDFTGLKGHAQGGMTRYGDGENLEAGLAFGTDLGDRAHLLASVDIYRQDAVSSFSSLRKRGFYKQWARVTNPDYDPNDPSSGAAQLVRPFVSPTNYTNGGIFNQPGSSLDKLEFLPDGSVAPLPFSGVGQLNGGCNCQAEFAQSYGVNRDDEVYTGYKRENAFVHLDYDVSDDVNVYVQGLYGHNRVSDRRESLALLGPWQTRIFADNAFLPDSVRQRMQDEGLESVGFGFFGINGPQTPLGDARQLTVNTLWSATAGFDAHFNTGGFMDDWRMNGYYQYGENKQDFDTRNGIRVDRFPLAMDAVVDPATGNIVCNAALVDPDHFSDCAPLNVFGGVQNVSQSAATYIVDDFKIARQNTNQHVAELLFTGEIWEGLGAGAVAGAFGASYRRDSLNQRTIDPTDEFPAFPNGQLLSDAGLLPEGVRGLIPEGEPNGIPGLRYVPNGFKGDANSSAVLFSSLREISGGYNVKELFGELNIPLLSDMAFAQRLDVTTALRYADYSGSGGIWAWKVGLDWAISDDVRIRATQSRDVRAATLRERFDQTRGGTNVQDPENNFALISTASFSGGNPNVAPEKADTTTIGAVFQPSFFSGFSTSVDWYRININGAIAQLASQNVVDGCFAGDQTLCQFVIRDPGTNQIVRVDNLFINLANQRISGVDVEMNYTSDIALFGGEELLSMRLYATWLDKNSIQNPGGPRDERAGDVGTPALQLPKYKMTANVTYANGPFSLFVQERWIDGGMLDHTLVEGIDIDNNRVKSAYFTDMRLGYRVGEDEAWELYLNVSNVFDQKPRVAAQAVGRTGPANFNSLYDVLGQRFVFGARFSY